MCFVVTCWERADLLALVCGVYCEFVTFPLISWVRCGTWLYRFLIFAHFLILKVINYRNCYYFSRVMVNCIFYLNFPPDGADEYGSHCKISCFLHRRSSQYAFTHMRNGNWAHTIEWISHNMEIVFPYYEGLLLKERIRIHQCSKQFEGIWYFINRITNRKKLFEGCLGFWQFLVILTWFFFFLSYT